MFFPIAQMPDSDVALVVRSHMPVAETTKAIDHMLRDIDASLPFTIQTWPEALALVLFPARAATVSLGVMGLLGAMLAMTGVFGISAYSVSKRKKEFGIRMALGTRPAQLMRAALGRPIALLICGSGIGLFLGVVSTQLLGQIVYEATPRDPVVWSGVIAAMALLGIVATWIPARRALATDPAMLVREER
jgi:ABC-type antimicrobial peptide transport system permease subunit